MNEKILTLLYEPFLADKNTLNFLLELVKNKNIEANTNTHNDHDTKDSANIHIHGLMFRYKNFLTNIGYGVSTEEIKQKIQTALDQNKHVNLIIDSGGGVVNGMSEFAEFIVQNRQNITAYVKGVCASAAFWAGASCGKLYVEKTSIIGSLGVVTTMADFSKMYESLGIIFKDFTSTKSPNKRLDIKTPEGEKEIKRELDEIAEIFITSVASSRNLSNDEIVKRLENGGVITGVEAVKREIADGVKPINNLHKKEKNMAISSPKVEKDVDVTPQADVPTDDGINKDNEELASLKRYKSKMEAIKLYNNKLDSEDLEALEAKDIDAKGVKDYLFEKLVTTKEPIPAIHVGEDLSKTSFNQDIEDALVLGMGLHVQNPSNRSLKLANGSIKAVIGGHSGLGFGNSDSDFMASMTTTEFPLLLTKAVNRVLVNTFEAQPVTYEALVEKVPHKDFKPQQDVELQHIQPSVFKEVVEGGELKAFTTKELGEISAIATYGAKYSLSRKMLINDDLGAFAKLFQGFGYASSHLINSLVYQLLEGKGAFEGYKLSDNKSFFDTSRGNIATTAGTISKDSISKARTALGRQTDKFGEPKMIMPEFILVPLELQTDTETFLHSTSIQDTNNANIANVFKNKFSIISDARLSNANAWYLGAKGAVKLGYLNQTKCIPQIEITNKNMVDGIEYSCLIDFKVYAGDPKRIYKNLGA